MLTKKDIRVEDECGDDEISFEDEKEVLILEESMAGGECRYK